MDDVKRLVDAAAGPSFEYHELATEQGAQAALDRWPLLQATLAELRIAATLRESALGRARTHAERTFEAEPPPHGGPIELRALVLEDDRGGNP